MLGFLRNSLSAVDLDYIILAIGGYLTILGGLLIALVLVFGRTP